MGERLKAILFDLDGTLVDALPDIQANTNRALRILGYDREISLEETRPLVGGGAQKLASGVLNKPMDDPHTMELYHTFTKVYMQHPADFGHPFPGVVETLTALQEHGILLSCVTAKPAQARIRVLDAMGIASFFQYAVSPEDGFLTKPAPDMLLACCRMMDVQPSETMMVGDTRYDLEAGFNAGCHAVAWCAHGYETLADDFKDRVITLEDFSELLPLFDDT